MTAQHEAALRIALEALEAIGGVTSMDDVLRINNAIPVIRRALEAGQPQVEQNPDAWLHSEGKAQPLYLDPQPKREPLTDKQIAEATGAKPGMPTWLVAVAFTRAIEAAHNIK